MTSSREYPLNLSVEPSDVSAGGSSSPPALVEFMRDLFESAQTRSEIMLTSHKVRMELDAPIGDEYEARISSYLGMCDRQIDLDSFITWYTSESPYQPLRKLSALDFRTG
jgi:hypothetical protein